MLRTICIGYDPREEDAYNVAHASVVDHTQSDVVITPIKLQELRDLGLYTRPTSIKDGKLFDDISEAPMSTEFAISRFLTPWVARAAQRRKNAARIALAEAKNELGWALFMDCDVMARESLTPLFEFCEANPEKALFCVRHKHNPPPGIKMDGQTQVRYQRKNWSSVMMINLDCFYNVPLTWQLINTVPGRDLHRFCWLDEYPEAIGGLPEKYNWLAFHSPEEIDPAIVHFTEGVPSMAGYENQRFADEWRAWAALTCVKDEAILTA